MQHLLVMIATAASSLLIYSPKSDSKGEMNTCFVMTVISTVYQSINQLIDPRGHYYGRLRPILRPMPDMMAIYEDSRRRNTLSGL